MKKNIFVLIICFCQALQPSKAQSWILGEVGVRKDNKTLKNAWAGGLNNPQFSAADLNHDGLNDLVVFERNGSRILTFLNEGVSNQPSYKFAPEYAENFPATDQFLLMRDYNKDNIMDIYSFYQSPITGIAGMRVLRGFFQNSKLNFRQVKETIYFPGFNNFPTNLFVLNGDIPSIDDIDNDGDMDILTFNQNGSYVDLFKNMSQEKGYGNDSLIYEWRDDCWGRFLESSLNGRLFLSDRVDSCVLAQNWQPRTNVHAGSTCTTVDLDGDGDKDFLVGDISSSHISMLKNGGTSSVAFMTEKDSLFPSYNTSIDIVMMPAAYILDVDNDGKKDMLVSPSQPNGSTNDKVAWWYKNIGTPNNMVFDYQQNDFLVDGMIEQGMGAYPRFFDYNADGLLDIVVGNSFLFKSNANSYSSLTLYKNVGTATNPAFEFVTDDYLNLYQYKFVGLVPSFGDLDEDGDRDAIIGEQMGTLIYLENTAGAGNPSTFANPIFNLGAIDVGQNSAPQFADLNRDGKEDLIIGEKAGNINYYENAGSSTYNLITTTLGQVFTTDTYFPSGYSQPFFIDVNGNYELFTGTASGDLRHYNQIDGNLSGSFTPLDSTYADTKLGYTSSIAVADINNDGKLDFLVGSNRGGIGLYSEVLISSGIGLHLTNDQINIRIYPNPVNESLSFIADETIEKIVFYDILGKYIQAYQPSANQYQCDVRNFPSGIYICEINSQKGKKIEKIIIQH